MMGTVSDLIQ